jgi:hypothetical protein
MKITNLLKLFIAVLVISLSACCHEVDCSAGSLNVIGFTGFTFGFQADTGILNNSVIRRYPIGSVLAPNQKIDSFKLRGNCSFSNTSNDTINVTIISDVAPFTISPGFKYVIYIPASGDSSRIDSLAYQPTQVQACSGTEYTAKSCTSPLAFIMQDSMLVGSKTSYEVIYMHY